MKFIRSAALILSSLAAFSLFAAAEQPVVSKNPFQKVQVSIVSLKSPQMNFEVDAKSEKNLKDKKDHPKRAKDWLCAFVDFKTVPSKDAKWPLWLENVTVELMIFIPAAAPSGRKGMAVFHGKQTLNPIMTDDKIHTVRFFAPPYSLARYYDVPKKTVAQSDKGKAKTESSSYRKEAKELAAFAIVSYGSMKSWGVQKPGKNFLERAKQYGNTPFAVLGSNKSPDMADRVFAIYKHVNDNRMNPRGFLLCENILDDASRTPFFSIEFDKYENTIPETRSK